MKRYCFVLLLLIVTTFSVRAQQIMYSSLKALVEERGDTVSTLRIEKRTKKLIYLMGGADYRISVDENSGMSRYLKSRCYAVRVDSLLYINCRKMRYKRYRFGNWYAPAMQIRDKIYYVAQPLGQVASSTTVSANATKLGGEIGDAINVTGLIDARVYYELDMQTGKSEFVGKERMKELLSNRPDLLEAFSNETSEEAEVIGRYLRQIK